MKPDLHHKRKLERKDCQDTKRGRNVRKNKRRAKGEKEETTIDRSKIKDKEWRRDEFGHLRGLGHPR